MTDEIKTGTDLEEALLAEEQEIDNAPDENATDRDIQAFDGFGSEGVAPAKINGEDYASLD